MRALMRLTGLPSAALWFLAGTFASNIGNGMHTLAAGALLYQQTGTVAAFGVVVVIEQAVTFLMQAVAGPSVDRGDPRRAAMLAEIVRGGCVCGLSLLLAASAGDAPGNHSRHDGRHPARPHIPSCGHIRTVAGAGARRRPDQAQQLVQCVPAGRATRRAG